jgi:hypothetical protein
MINHVHIILAVLAHNIQYSIIVKKKKDLFILHVISVENKYLSILIVLHIR